eukprot:CAMPEP_0197717194 /NCGR_PEP_ID=MMETSP1434-20131217/1816_1 /TAXON_ID=265543 /ORGANISM="Minutocellus polymorphus, Strain CCMP3303" /LENGTH=207 /DNA_ID=CAMNT_0043301685 /DNA_START=82 /DNA_END=705 /DNA_ORIENTATION=-
MLRKLALSLIASFYFGGSASVLVSAFQPSATSATVVRGAIPFARSECDLTPISSARKSPPTTSLFSRLTPDRSDPTADGADNPGDILFAIQNDELVLGLSGTLASLIVFYSEYTLSQTGCGLPAGPGGIYGAMEGLSYLEVAGIFILSLINKVTTGKGLPSGRFGALGAAEGLSFLAVFGGIGVLAYQMTHYGYIPNAVPMEGGMCQ